MRRVLLVFNLPVTKPQITLSNNRVECFNGFWSFKDIPQNISVSPQTKRTYGPQRNKPCLWGFQTKQDSGQSPQLQRLAWETWNFACCKFRYGTFQKVNNRGADAQAGLPFCCLQTPEDRFSRVVAHIKSSAYYFRVWTHYWPLEWAYGQAILPNFYNNTIIIGETLNHQGSSRYYQKVSESCRF